jgi:D-alanine transaminase
MNPQLPLANVNGDVLPLAEVRISALDRGFLFGDAVYEVLRVYAGRPWLEEEHFQRLERSLSEIRLAGVDAARMRGRMHQTLKQSGVREGIVYIQVTRGSAPRKHAFPKGATPLELLWVQEFVDPYIEARLVGIRVVSQPDVRWERCDIKTTNLLGNILAMQAAVEADCIEAILHLPDGTLTEGTHTNLFGVAGGRLITHPTGPGILPGCTRGLLLRLAGKVGITVEEGTLNRNHLDTLSELFVSGTTSEVLPVVQVDGHVIGNGAPGPITRRLQQAYAEAVTAFVART